MLFEVIFFILSCLFLVLSGSWTIKYITRLAASLRISHFSIGFIIMALATSFPELFVGISSALAKNPSISLGNVIGANILDLTLVIAIPALLGAGIKIKSKTLKRDSIMMLLTALAPLILTAFDKTLSRSDGVILILIFIVYGWHLFTEKIDFKTNIEKKNTDKIINILFFLGSIMILFLSSKFVVKFGSEIANGIGLPAIFVGLLFISLGTTLPELTFNIHSVLKKKPDLAVGNSMGSVICNSLLVLGVTSIIHPIQNGFTIFFTSAIFMILISMLFIFFIKREKGLSITQAIILIILYVLFLMFEFFFK